MNASEYQKQALRTFKGRVDFDVSPEDQSIIWHALGLVGEAGEIAEHVKKGVLHQHGLDRDKMFKELGDVCWYLAALCSNLGVDLGDVMNANIEKLRIRYPEGFSSKDSINRIDTKGQP